MHVEGNDLAVYRVADGQIVAAWFYADGYDPQALSQVFAFAGASNAIEQRLAELGLRLRADGAAARA